MPKKSGPLIQHLDDDKRTRALADPPPKPEKAEPEKPAEKPRAERAPDGTLPTIEDLKQSTREWAVREQLAAPFHPDELVERPDGTRHVLPAAVAQRLDEVLGPTGWGFQLHADGPTGSLALKVGSGACVREAQGGDPGAALVACAELFGVGRYLRKVPPGPLPEWALPRIPDRDRRPWFRGPVEAASTPKAEPANPAPPKPEPPKAEAPKPEPKGPPEPKPAPKGPATEDEWVNEWLGKFASADTPEEFTAMLPGLKQVPPEFKKAVWDAVCDEAREYGWRYDAAAKKFFLESDLNEEPPLEF